MGADAQQRAARPDEIVAMQDLLRECLQAGAVGLSTSFVDVDEKARPVPSRFAQFDELDALCAVLGEFGVSSASARAALSRLTSRELLIRSRRGRRRNSRR